MKRVWRMVEELAEVPTAPGKEGRVVAWVRRWAGRRGDVELFEDPSGNLLLSLEGNGREPVVTVAHMDHPGLVAEEVAGRSVVAAFRGGVDGERFAGAAVELVDGSGGRHPGTVRGRDGDRVEIGLRSAAPGLAPGDIGRWRFPAGALGVRDGLLRAHACDDLVGAAACLAALDAARRSPERHHLAVLLTRAEEVGMVGAMAAVRNGTLPAGARIISVETSKAFPESPVGGGPVLRVGDAATVFDAALTNTVADVLRDTGLDHRRRLMPGGTCEASVFVAAGLPATGMCVPLGNYHNMADDDPRGIAPEVVSLADVDGLVRMIGAAAERIDAPPPGLGGRLARLWKERSGVLE